MNADGVLAQNRGRVHPGAGFEVRTSVAATADVTLTTDDPRHVDIDATAGAFAITLPIGYEGLEFHLSEKAGLATAVTITAGSGETIHGLASLTMNAAYRQRTLRHGSGTDWIVIGGIG